MATVQITRRDGSRGSGLQVVDPPSQWLSDQQMQQGWTPIATTSRHGGALGSKGASVRVTESQIEANIYEARKRRECFVLVSDSNLDKLRVRIPAYYWSHSRQIYRPVDLISDAVSLNVHDEGQPKPIERTDGSILRIEDYRPLTSKDATQQICRLTDAEWKSVDVNFRSSPKMSPALAEAAAMEKKYLNQCFTTQGYQPSYLGKDCQCADGKMGKWIAPFVCSRNVPVKQAAAPPGGLMASAFSSGGRRGRSSVSTGWRRRRSGSRRKNYSYPCGPHQYRSHDTGRCRYRASFRRDLAARYTDEERRSLRDAARNIASRTRATRVDYAREWIPERDELPPSWAS